MNRLSSPHQHGPQVGSDGVTFNLWAPTARTVELLEIGQPACLLESIDNGWYQYKSLTAHPGTRYQYRIDGNLIVPDPASLFQPEDVHDPSEVIDTAALQNRATFVNRSWAEAVIYEVHVGSFSDVGTYAGVEERLPYLRDLGITAVELMPLNDVPGRFNWGYDGVLLNAPNARYGRPEELQSLLRTAHELDMMVYLDVVYNHFGPHCNFLHNYAKHFFTDRHTTGWGPAVNLEGEHGAFVRGFLINNALMWLRDYGFDGLRFDAVHALKDDSHPHFLIELAETIRSALPDRQIHLILENEANQASLLERSNGHRLYNAQWGDDFHNALHVLLTGEKEGYYSAFADKPLEHLARSLTEGFAYQGEVFPLNGKPRGEPSKHLPPEATVFFAQNHDQVGNRALGERLAQLVSPDRLAQAMALLILSPHIPLLFMGEEAAAETPFLFFADWTGEAARLTREGRREEFANFTAFSTAKLRDKIPDPCDERTFAASKLNWHWIEESPAGAEFRNFTRALLKVRRDKILPLIKQGFVKADFAVIGKDHFACGIDVRWRTASGACLQIITNFGSESVPMPNIIAGETLWPLASPIRNLIQPAEIFAQLTFAADRASEGSDRAPQRQAKPRSVRHPSDRD
jgi:maltooligosyltrehalose trehalohydrolase